MAAQMGDTSAKESADELNRLRARNAELESKLAASERRERQDSRNRFQEALYEAMLYGLGRTLSLYDPSSVRLLVREIGRRIREYLEESGYHLAGGNTPDEVMDNIVSFFVSHGFVELEPLGRVGDVLHFMWHRLLGLPAYERIDAAGSDTFISCPLNAVLCDALGSFDKELVIHEKRFYRERQAIESWEELVDVPPAAQSGALSLDPERVLLLEREQSRQLRVRDEFIRIASHELSTPLTSTKLALSRLERSELPEGAARSIAMLNRQVRRLEQLVNQMLDTTRLQIGRISLEREPVDLVQVTRSVIELLSTGERPAASSMELLAARPIVGRWDASRLEQVVTNLLTNAVKYGEGRAIEVEVTEKNGWAQLVVRDRGIGIPAEALQRIFDPFERAVPVEHYGGLGLGLFIARRIVEMHGGMISVESELGHGAEFTVELPLEGKASP